MPGHANATVAVTVVVIIAICRALIENKSEIRLLMEVLEILRRRARGVLLIMNAFEYA